jgi:hypothetical protein
MSLWQKCEAMEHVGPERPVAWRDLGLMCDVCYEAFGDMRALRQQLEGAIVIDDAAIIRAANAIGQLGTDRIGAEPYAAARAILDAARGQ